MKIRHSLVGLIAVSCPLLAAGCSTSPSAHNAATTSNPATTGTADTAAPGTAGSSGDVVNVPVTDQTRAQLVDAGAALNDIPASQYTGLAPGLTYYAFDKATKVYWAGARLVPAASSDPSSPTQAQISSQDAGSYYLFNRAQSGEWTAYAAGNTGPNSSCPISVPAAVIQVWGWTSGGCRPSGV